MTGQTPSEPKPDIASEFDKLTHTQTVYATLTAFKDNLNAKLQEGLIKGTPGMPHPLSEPDLQKLGEKVLAAQTAKDLADATRSLEIYMQRGLIELKL